MPTPLQLALRSSWSAAVTRPLPRPPTAEIGLIWRRCEAHCSIPAYLFFRDCQDPDSRPDLCGSSSPCPSRPGGRCGPRGEESACGLPREGSCERDSGERRLECCYFGTWRREEHHGCLRGPGASGSGGGIHPAVEVQALHRQRHANADGDPGNVRISHEVAAAPRAAWQFLRGQIRKHAV